MIKDIFMYFINRRANRENKYSIGSLPVFGFSLSKLTNELRADL